MDQKLFSQTVRSIRRKIRTARKYLSKSKTHLETCKDWEAKEHLTKLLQSIIFQEKKKNAIEVYDWTQDRIVKIDLNPDLTPQDELKMRFKEVRKLKKGLFFAEKEHARAIQEMEKWNQALKRLGEIKTDQELENFRKLYEIKFPVSTSQLKEILFHQKKYKEYYSSENIPILVGKSAQGNEDLTFKHAHGNDLWLHVADYSGSHVVIKPKKSQKIDDKTLYEAMQLALYHSRAKDLKEAEVSYTYIKHVKKIGKVKGKVQIANESRRKDLCITFKNLEKFDRLLPSPKLRGKNEFFYIGRQRSN